MTGTMLALTIFEFAAVVLIIVGLLNEKKLIAFEDRLGTTIGTAIGKRLRRHYIKKKAKTGKHLRAVPARKESVRSAECSNIRYIA
ncbi:MAG: hypothetical protein IJZ57_06155 [Clostridia bacterium]|nr:hypothetical protein [Clostridia bacterium]